MINSVAQSTDEPAEDTRMFMLTPLHDESDEVNNISVTRHARGRYPVRRRDRIDGHGRRHSTTWRWTSRLICSAVIGEDSTFDANEIIVEGPLPSP